jgi:DNA ligase-associated metallophosphoesterase
VSVAGSALAGAASIDLASQRVALLPARAAWWPAEATVLVADLHWGKSQTFRALGVPVPCAELEEDLARLGAVVRDTGARRVVVLGDLVHAREGVTEEVIARVAAWRRTHPCAIVLVRGNHDRHVQRLPEAWGIEVVERPLRDGPFVFVHDPEDARGCADAYAFAGHVHPAVRVGRGRLSVRVPCFHVGVRRAVLPAFSTFTGGAALPRAPGDRVYGLVSDSVIDV